MTVHLLEEIEIIVAKGEIACFEQFLLLSQCFQKLSESVYMRERVKAYFIKEIIVADNLWNKK